MHVCTGLLPQLTKIVSESSAGQLTNNLSFLVGGSTGDPVLAEDAAPFWPFSWLAPYHITDRSPFFYCGTEIKKQACGLGVAGYDVKPKMGLGSLV